MEVPSIFLNRILSEAAKKNASNLRLSVGSVPIARINGLLTAMDNESILDFNTLDKIIGSFLDEEELARLKKDREIVIVKSFANSFRFRVNIFYQKDLPSFSFNYIPKIIRNLDDLELGEMLKKIINLKSGLLVVAGSNDSGKTSTIASIIENINNTQRKYVITIEDPIEYLFVNQKSIIEQRQVGRDVKSYTDGLMNCLNEDLDFLYIDEIKKEFEFAIPYIFELAAGNSLVIIEINANSSVRAIEKILNAAMIKISDEAARYNLADSLVGIITQKLIPGIGGGMLLASEVLMVNSAVKSLIREGKFYQIESIVQTSREEGMISMNKSIEKLIKEGKIKTEEINKIKLD